MRKPVTCAMFMAHITQTPILDLEIMARKYSFLGRLTYANVVSSVCLFLVLGGSAYAAVTLRNNSVGANHIKNNAIHGTGRLRIAHCERRTSRRASFPQVRAAPRGRKGRRGRREHRVRRVQACPVS